MLVIALFIIVVMSLLAATLSRVLSSTADSVADEVYSAKAYYAAESAMDYGIYQILINKQSCADFPALTSISGATNLQFDISNEVGLENCSVTIKCQRIPVNNSSLFYLISTGTCDGGKIIAEHNIEAEVKI
ncbi:pilus assembly PilX N-terminal domain-containing protein [Moritella sp. 5]|nr:pilus assembly PilX N-terminal domain-containing protein [Moritella sp. 5]